MNLEKIKKYNHALLAVLGSVVLVISLIGLAMLLWSIASDLFSRPENRAENILLSEERADALAQQNVRQQVISYDSPWLADSVNLVYIVPVGMRMLDEPEAISDAELPTYGIEVARSVRSKKYTYYGTFVNLVLYDHRNGTSWKISEQRVLGSDFQVEYLPDDILLTFRAAQKDTNADGLVTPNDFMGLFVYSFKNKSLKIANQEGATVLSYERVEDSKEFLVVLGIDRNQDKRFTDHKEPTQVMRYHAEHGTFENLVSAELSEELQRILDRSGK